jgi:SAM-dependent methyltransferase
MIELALRGAIRQGLGVELSRSRTEFARRWAEEAGCSEHLAFRNCNALALELESASWDAVICISGTFSYFDAVEPGSASRLLNHVRAALRPDGLLILELYPHPSERRLLAAGGNSIQTWRELDDDDPWRFYLSALTLRGDVLTHTKTFIHRTSGTIDEGRSERIVLYTPETIAELLKASGFTRFEMRDGWSDAPYSHGDVLVVTAGTAR